MSQNNFYISSYVAIADFHAMKIFDGIFKTFSTTVLWLHRIPKIVCISPLFYTPVNLWICMGNIVYSYIVGYLFL